MTTVYPFFEYFLECLNYSGFQMSNVKPANQKQYKPPFYCGLIEDISVIDPDGNEFTVSASVSGMTAKVFNYPAAWNKYPATYIMSGKLARAIEYERDSLDELDKCKKCGEYSISVSNTIKNGRVGTCRSCKHKQQLSPALTISNIGIEELNEEYSF